MEYNSFMEALKGKQHKIDKNKNGKVDAHDFELLRKEESEELDEIHRMKTKLNKLDDVSNKSVARQKLSNLMKSGKARGALIANKMRTLNMGDDLDQEDLDALHEVLSKDAKAGDWISDFVHSTNPKFDGKSKKERINMALGAYYDTQKKKDGISEGNGYDDNRRGFGKPPREDDEYHVPDPTVKKAKLKKEEVEELDEKSEQAKQNKTMKNMMDASRGARYKLNNPVPDADPEHKTAQAHNKAIGRALRNEDKMTTTKDKSGKLVSFKYEGDWKKISKADAKKDPAGKVANMAGQSMQKMAKANEQAPVAPVPDKKYIKGTPENKAYKATKKPINGMPTNKMCEEKDEQEYGYEGDMALNQLATLTRCADMIKEILKPDTDLPEWVQSKITLATDYIQTAADYMHSEMNEAKSVEVKVNAAGDAAHEEKWEPVKKVKKPVEEAVQKVDIPAYLRKAKGDTPLKMDDLKRKDTISDPENLKRNRGVKESFDDEGNLISNKVSYKEFMLEYTPGPGGVTQIKGRSYGANYSDPEGADDADDNKPMKPAAEKRGRGRPAGAKSGARKITGTSKLMNK